MKDEIKGYKKINTQLIVKTNRGHSNFLFFFFFLWRTVFSPFIFENELHHRFENLKAFTLVILHCTLSSNLSHMYDQYEDAKLALRVCPPEIGT